MPLSAYPCRQSNLIKVKFCGSDTLNGIRDARCRQTQPSSRHRAPPGWPETSVAGVKKGENYQTKPIWNKR